MSRLVPLRLKRVLAAAAVAAALPLAACNNPLAGAYEEEPPYALPELPATLPLVPGEATPPVNAPVAAQIPYAEPIQAGYIPEPAGHYAYAEDAWGFTDAVGYAPPDYGFNYDDVEPWAWQGYDNSMMFVEPLDYGYRSYYYHPGDEYPYFVREPDYGYGYDGGRLAVIYGSDGRVIHYTAYETYLPFASAYYYRGHNLWRASRHRHPVIVGNWEYRRHGIYNGYRHWSQERARQRDWMAYHRRIDDRQDRYWERERGRRLADRVRYASWREQDFRTPPPPRAIPARWTRADWARDERRYAAPARGFTGDRQDQRRAARQERVRLAALNRRAVEQRRDRVQNAAEQRRDRREQLAQLRDSRRDQRVDRRGEVRQAALRADRREDRRTQAQAVREQRVAQRDRAQTQRQQAENRNRQRQVRAERQRSQAEQRRDARTARTQAQERQQRQTSNRAQARQQRETQSRRQAEVREQRQSQARERQQSQARERQQSQARERRQAQANDRAQARERQQAQVRERRQAGERRQQQSQAREQAQQRRAEQSQARQASQERRQQAEQRQQQRSQARPQQREAARTQRQERPQRQERAQAKSERTERTARVAQARTERQEARRERREARQR